MLRFLLIFCFYWLWTWGVKHFFLIRQLSDIDWLWGVKSSFQSGSLLHWVKWSSFPLLSTPRLGFLNLDFLLLYNDSYWTVIVCLSNCWIWKVFLLFLVHPSKYAYDSQASALKLPKCRGKPRNLKAVSTHVILILPMTETTYSLLKVIEVNRSIRNCRYCLTYGQSAIRWSHSQLTSTASNKASLFADLIHSRTRLYCFPYRRL